MRAMGSLDELQQKQADAAKLALRMAEEKDPDRLEEMVEQLQARCSDLERMARGLEAALSPAGGDGKETRVVLTPAQQARITEATGVGVEVVVLRDSKEKTWSREMPGVEPREIERMAAKQAAASKLESATRAQVEKIVRELKALEAPGLEETIARLEKDPALGLGAKGK